MSEMQHPDDYDERPAAAPAEPTLVGGGLLYVPAESADSRNPEEIERTAREFVARHPELGPDAAVEPIRTDAHHMQLVESGEREEPWHLRGTQPGGPNDYGPEAPGVFVFVGPEAEKVMAAQKEREQERELGRADDALGWGDELARTGHEEAATAAYGSAHRHEHQAAEAAADAETLRDADTLRYEAATAYSTTVAGPPGPKNAGAQQQGQQPAPQQQQQQQQAPQRRVR